MITIDFARSLQGRECISMKLADQSEWILLATKRADIATIIMQGLKDSYSIQALAGFPFGLAESLGRKEFCFVKDCEWCIGIYIPALLFDFVSNEINWFDLS